MMIYFYNHSNFECVDVKPELDKVVGMDGLDKEEEVGDGVLVLHGVVQRRLQS